jgi:hypothetical protein
MVTQSHTAQYYFIQQSLSLLQTLLQQHSFPKPRLLNLPQLLQEVLELDLLLVEPVLQNCHAILSCLDTTQQIQNLPRKFIRWFDDTCQVRDTAPLVVVEEI